MINLTATTESNPQTIFQSKITDPSNSSWYWALRCVAWISQNTGTLESTILYKWQVVQFNYYPYWGDSHSYTVTLDGTSSSVNFALPQSKSNGTRNMSSAKTLGTFAHNETTGEYSGTFRFRGAIPWTTFDYSEAMTLPTISVPEPSPEPSPEPEPTPEPPAPLEFDDNPRFYIYSDDQLVYGAGIKGYEVLKPRLSLEVNKAGSLTFDIPIGSEMYDKIAKLKSTIEVRQGNEILFRGRLLNTERTMMNTVSCYCEGFMSWLNDITIAPYTFNGEARNFLKQIIDNYNERASENRQLTFEYSDISARISVETKDYSNMWKEIKSVLIDGVGGYVVPYLTSEETGVQWLSTYGKSTSQVIQFGKNLLDFREYIDASQIFTAVRPYGKMVDGTRISLPEVFLTDSDAIEKFGRIERTAIFDEVTTESALRTVAADYLRTGVEQALTMKLKAVDLHLLDIDAERIRLGDSVRCVSVPHGIDAYFLCNKMEIDMEHLKNSEYTFGSTRRTISELTDASYNRYVITEGA